MDHRQVLIDAARRPLDSARAALDGIDPRLLDVMPEGRCNSIGWLVWHAARQMDVQTVALSGGPSVWTSGGWSERLGVERGEDDFGLGDGIDEVTALHLDDPTALVDLLSDCIEALVAHIDTLSAQDLDTIIDRSWDPPVSQGVRLVSIIDDAVAHLGQVAYVRGLVEGWSADY